jgi:CheY-like chemotaxis protein
MMALLMNPIICTIPCIIPLTKDKQRSWKRILIVDNDVGVTTPFKEGIEENNKNDANKRIEVHTSNDPVAALSEFKPNFYDLLLVDINMFP